MLKAESYILDYYSDVTLMQKNGDGNLAKQNIVNHETTNKSDLKAEKI